VVHFEIITFFGGIAPIAGLQPDWRENAAGRPVFGDAPQRPLPLLRGPTTPFQAAIQPWEPRPARVYAPFFAIKAFPKIGYIRLLSPLAD
jgi:hypothetical protein